MKPALLSGILYAGIAAIIGRDVLWSLGSGIANDAGDPVFTAAILTWNAVHIPWTDAWFQFPIFHPTADTLALSEHLLGISIVFSPIYWLTGNPLTAYNLTLLLAYPLSGLAMYALVRRVTRQPAAAFLAGLAFAFAPYRVSHLPHIHVQMVFWAPLALLGLHAFIDPADPPSVEPALHGRRTRRLLWLALFAVCWMLQGASNGYFLVFFSILAGFWVLWFVVARGRWRDLAWIAGATAIASVPLLPILYRYITVQRELGLSRNLGEIAFFGADIAGVLCAAPALTFWGWLQIACGPEGELFVGAALVAMCVAAAMTGQGGTETRSEGDTSRLRHSIERRGVSVARAVALAVAAMFLGIGVGTAAIGPWSIDLGFLRASASSVDKPLSTALALLLVAFVLSPSFHRSVRRGSITTFYLGAAIVCWIFAWGPFPRFFGTDALYQAPFAWLLQLPGLDSLRVPARFWMMTVICLCVFLGIVMARLLSARSPRSSASITAVAAIALLMDGWTTIRVAGVPGEIPNAAALRGGTVLFLPVGDLYADVAAVYRAVMGGWRSINGYSGYEPGYYQALRTLSLDADDALLGPFLERGDIHVLVDERAPQLRAMVERQPGVRFLARDNGMHLYRIGRVPAGAAGRTDLGTQLDPREITASCDPVGVPLLTDGDFATSWVCGLQTQDEEITIDLGSPTTVGAVVLALGPNGSGFPHHLIVETSLDAGEWEPVWQGSPAAAVLRAALEAPRQARVPVEFSPRETRRLRLRQVGRDERYWSVAELEVWTGAP